MPQKLAIILFNLGGPDRPEFVWPFLVNLFSDRAILRTPFFIRFWLARFIALQRLPPAQANYALLGGKSPLLELTQRQAAALETTLNSGKAMEAKCFAAMRHWRPFSHETVQAVKKWAPDRILLLPLYPHYSTTTTGSSFTDWRESAACYGLAAPVTTLCCWHSDAGVIAANARLIRRTYEAARRATLRETRLRVLFSAHGLPESIIEAGDPYQHQIECSVTATVKALALPSLDYRICYQSRATPQKWLDPATEHEIEQAARDKTALVVVPIAFVSDHSETLVELDIEYRALAENLGVPGFFRVPALNDDPAFILALADLARRTAAQEPGLYSFAGPGLCPKTCWDCPHFKA